MSRFRVLWGFAWAYFALAGPLAGVALLADDAVLPSHNALSSTPWYDPAKDQLVPVRVKTVTDDSDHRDSRWLPGAERVKQPGSSASGGGSGFGSGLFGTGLTWINLLGWALLVLMLLAVVSLLLYIFSRADWDPAAPIGSRGPVQRVPDEQTVERMKHLPAELRRTDVNLRDEAQRLMQQAAFDQAIILLFGHQLLLLDQAGSLRLTRGKTNGRYVRETRASDPQLGSLLETTVASFERSYFGRHAIVSDEFARIWENNLVLEQALRARHEVAA